MTCIRSIGDVSLLLVEDDKSLREAMVRGLTNSGFRVTTAGTGVEAVEAVRVTSPDAVVIDVFLPDAGGLGVARELRRQQGLESIPILFITGLSLPVLRDTLSPAPVLFKPFTYRELVASVRQVLRELSSPVKDCSGSMSIPRVHFVS